MKYFVLFLIALSFPLKASSQFVMPIGGEQNKDWFIWTYMDHDTANGSVRNFHCSDYVYDNWNGIIFVLKNLQLMDQGIPVFASGAGRVVSSYNKSSDRQKVTLNSDHGNYLRIKHDTNLYSFYAYLKKGSLQFKVGDSVNKGDIIAYVGASGGGYYSNYISGSKIHSPENFTIRWAMIVKEFLPFFPQYQFMIPHLAPLIRA